VPPALSPNRLRTQLRVACEGGAENARMENAGMENTAPYCRVGKRETGKRGNVFLWKAKHVF